MGVLVVHPVSASAASAPLFELHQCLFLLIPFLNNQLKFSTPLDWAPWLSPLSLPIFLITLMFLVSVRPLQGSWDSKSDKVSETTVRFCSHKVTQAYVIGAFLITTFTICWVTGIFRGENTLIIIKPFICDVPFGIVGGIGQLHISR